MRKMRNHMVYGQYIRRIALHMMKLQDDLLLPYNITSQQARMVGVVHMLLDQRGVCSQKDLERECGLRGSSVTSLLQGLEKRGYLCREPGEDARTKRIALTDRGREMVDTFLKILHESERKIVEGMTGVEKSILLELLRRAAENVDRAEEAEKSFEL